MSYRVDEHAFTSSAQLLKIGAFATVAFAVMMLLTWHGERALTIVIGALIVGVLFGLAVWYSVQERYPPATLFGDRRLELSAPFHGYIETDERNVRDRAVRLQVLSNVGARRGAISVLRQTIPADQIRKSGGGKVRIPVSLPAFPRLGSITLLKVRSRWFPFGWGSTFDITPSD